MNESKANKKHFYLVLIFFIGFTSLIYEIYSTKILFLFFLETSWAVTIAISAFLAGLAFSSLFFSFLVKNNKKELIILWLMQISIALYGFFVLSHYEIIPKAVDFSLQNHEGDGFSHIVKIIFFWIYLFIPAFFIGGSFPLVNNLYLQKHPGKPFDSGLVYFWDTIGSVIGALLAGFWLLPTFGFISTVGITAFVNLILALILAPGRRGRILTMFLSIGVLSLFYVTTIQPNNMPELAKNFGAILFQEDSPFGKVTVGLKTHDTTKDQKQLFINYRIMCDSTGYSSETGIGELSVKQQGEHLKVVNIGLGCGFTADALVSKPNIDNLTIVEINPVVVKASKYFNDENDDVLSSPKTKLIIQDGAWFLRSDKGIYDAIVIDIEEPTIVDSSPLYTKEYFRYAKDRLKPSGILSVWAQRGGTDYEKVIYNTLKSVFKNVYIRVLYSFYTFYASDANYSFPVDSVFETSDIKQVLQNPLGDINTIDNRVLGKYFNVNVFFNFPDKYHDPSTILFQ